MLIAAGVVLVLAVVLAIIAQTQAAKAGLIAGTETSQAADLAGLAGKIAADIGAGSFAQYVELKGRAVAEPPLRAEFSGADCVFYDCVVTREYEEEYWETDKEGRRQRRTRRGSEEVSRVRRDPPFLLDDGSGRVTVDPAGAALEPLQTFSRFEPGEGGPRLNLGSWSFALPMFPGGRRTLGFRFEEKSIPVGQELYVLGEIADSGGKLAVRKPGGKGQKFIVSVKSEEALVSGAKTAALWLRVGAGVAAAGAVALAVAAFVAV
jgi:hypothetical protein